MLHLFEFGTVSTREASANIQQVEAVTYICSEIK